MRILPLHLTLRTHQSKQQIIVLVLPLIVASYKGKSSSDIFNLCYVIYLEKNPRHFLQINLIDLRLLQK